MSHGVTLPSALSLIGVKSNWNPSVSSTVEGLSYLSTLFWCKGHTPCHGVHAETSVSHDLKVRLMPLKYFSFSSAVQFS